jgi:hypothetical protein
VLTFEGGSRLELTPIDYTLERRSSNGTLVGCTSLFYDTDRVPGIVVGAGVLEHYITEWDLDRKEIRRKFDLQFQPKYLKFLLTCIHCSGKAEQAVAEMH